MYVPSCVHYEVRSTGSKFYTAAVSETEKYTWYCIPSYHGITSYAGLANGRCSQYRLQHEDVAVSSSVALREQLMEEQVNHEATPVDVISKPIKKRVVVQDDRDRDDYDAFERTSYNRKSSSNQETSSLESNARRELISYVGSKGFDVNKEIQGYKVHVKLPKNERHNDNRRPIPTITYTSPDGVVYSSKAAVVDALKLSTRHRSRAEIYSSAVKKYQSFIRGIDLPVDVDGIKVIEFGSIDSSESALHSSVEIYPIGYVAEIIMQTMDRGRSLRVLCEVSLRNGQPEFKITVLSSGHVYTASSESAVWKKVTASVLIGATTTFVSYILVNKLLNSPLLTLKNSTKQHNFLQFDSFCF